MVGNTVKHAAEDAAHKAQAAAKAAAAQAAAQAAAAETSAKATAAQVAAEARAAKGAINKASAGLAKAIVEGKLNAVNKPEEAVAKEGRLLREKTKAVLAAMSACGQTTKGTSDLGQKFASWMANSAVSRLMLTQLSLPGTHDSASYQLHPSRAQRTPDQARKYDSLARSFGVDPVPFEVLWPLFM